MSHVVTIKTEVRDPVAIAGACRRLTLLAPTEGTAKLFGTEATGWLVRLRDWRYPLVCQSVSGQLHYDNCERR